MMAVPTSSLRKRLEDLTKKRDDAMLRLSRSKSGGSGADLSMLQDMLSKGGDKARVDIKVRGSEVFIAAFCSKTQEKVRFSRVLEVIREHELELVRADVSSDSGNLFYYIHANAKVDWDRNNSIEALETVLGNLNL